MISNIIDSNGFLVYSGNDINSKFATVLEKEGHSRVDGNAPDLMKPKWDGSAWVEGKTDTEIWEKTMKKSDGKLPRWGEDLINLTDGAISPQAQKLADEKKALRATRP